VEAPASVREVVLLGAGGLARETAAAVRSGVKPEGFAVIGYLDDAPALVGARVSGLPVLGATSMVQELPSRVGFVATVASSLDVTRRRRLVQKVALEETRWVTLVHSSAQLGECTTVGIGCVILANSVATADVVVGRHVVVMPGCVLTHDTVVGDYATLASGVLLSGNVRIGELAYLGTGSMVREGLRVGAGAVVGMGSVVTRDVPDGEIWAGVPARRIGTVGPPGAPS
jgi:sugar O-acyltransferase (sialic acid O-acetyltransferase NeuD family)